MLWEELQALKSCILHPHFSPHCAVSQIIYLLILLSWPHKSIDWIESLLIKFADEMTRSLENCFGIKNEFSQLERIYAMDKDWTRWPLWSLLLSYSVKNWAIYSQELYMIACNIKKRLTIFIKYIYVYIIRIKKEWLAQT